MRFLYFTQNLKDVKIKTTKVFKYQKEKEKRRDCGFALKEGCSFYAGN